MDSSTRNYLGADFFFFISHCTSIFFTIDFTCTWMLASSIYPYFLFNFTCTNLVITCLLHSCTHACATYLSACKWMTNIYSLCPKKTSHFRIQNSRIQNLFQRTCHFTLLKSVHVNIKINCCQIWVINRYKHGHFPFQIICPKIVGWLVFWNGESMLLVEMWSCWIKVIVILIMSCWVIQVIVAAVEERSLSGA